MFHFIEFGLTAMIAVSLGGCQPSYSPDTYSSAALQQANKVETGIVVGFRQVAISADGTVGTVTGAAAGGILGAAEPDPTGIPTALTALGGSVVGGLVGSTIAHTTGDTTGWEYIVREPNGDLVSVTQREPKPIAIGQKVLVITGKQARIIPDYATALPATDAAAAKAKPKDKEPPSATPATPTTPAAPPPPAAAAPADAAPPAPSAMPAAATPTPPATTTSTPDSPTGNSSGQAGPTPPSPAGPTTPASPPS